MSEFRSILKLEKCELEISHKEEVIFLGSCFSDEIGNKFKNAGFKTFQNPFGTIFHPLALSRLLDSNIDFEKSIFKRNDVFLSWYTSSLFWNLNPVKLQQDLNKQRDTFHEKLKNCGVLFMTFGSSWEYFHLGLKEIVANCHKTEQKYFEKKLSPTAVISKTVKQSILELQHIYPNLKIVFTVSPVRHLREGLVENNRSKARLFEVIHSIIDEVPNTSYFPSFELINDDLRDYRFFEKDLMHPNTQAIEYVWENLKTYYFTASTKGKVKKVENARILLNHLPNQIGTIEANALQAKKDAVENEMKSDTGISWT
jgi:hypothetical protein